MHATDMSEGTALPLLLSKLTRRCAIMPFWQMTASQPVRVFSINEVRILSLPEMISFSSLCVIRRHRLSSNAGTAPM